MELRVLTYFLMICETENITLAAEKLHLTQPTLTRQLRDLEEELGVTLFVRGKRKTTLTEEGRLLRKRAEEVKGILEKARSELSNFDDFMDGDVYIGCGETESMRQVAEVVRRVQQKYPAIRVHFSSGNEADVRDRLDRGLLDFGFLITAKPPRDYEYFQLCGEDVWGVIMKSDSPLAKRRDITARDLEGVPLIASQQAVANQELAEWLADSRMKLDMRADYNLIYNAALLVDEGVGCALGLDRLVSTYGMTGLTFRPLSPRVTANIYCIWQKNQVFSRAALYFRDELERYLNERCSACHGDSCETG